MKSPGKKRLNVYDHRWNYLVKMFGIIKKYIDDGYLVMAYDAVLKNIIITDQQIFEEDDNCKFVFVENTPEQDDGLLQTKKEWKRWFEENIKIYEKIPLNVTWSDKKEK